MMATSVVTISAPATRSAGPSASAPGPVARVVLLGASNLTRGIVTAVTSARRQLAGPLDLMIAMGHGRSYGLRSRVMGRCLPGILQCGLWDALSAPASSEKRPVHAIITDVGNDIMYGVDAPTICAWIDECVDRLQAHGARVTLTQLPMAMIERLSPWKFRAVKALLFPTRRVTMDQAARAARLVNDHLLDLATRRGLAIQTIRPEWYGWDPIHYRQRHFAEAWTDFTRSWRESLDAVEAAAATPLASWWQMRTARPREMRWLGLSLGRPQPARRWSDGTTLSLF